MSRSGLCGAALLAGLLLATVVAQWWTPWPVDTLDIAHRLAPPSAAHWLGTDHYGRDELSLLLAGGLPAFATAAVALAIGLSAGVPLGLIAAARDGWADEVIGRGADLLFGFPALVLALLLVAVAGPGWSRAALAIGLFNVPVFVRVTRSAARGILARDFIRAARLAGRSEAAIAWTHVLPNIAGGLVVQAVLQFALGLTAESALSYLGLGAQPPQPSWGRMLADGQALVADAPRLVLLPGLALLLAIGAANLIAADVARRWRR